VNDVLSRAVAYAISRTQHKDVEIGINDNGFYIASHKKIDVVRALKLIKANELRDVLEKAIENTEVFKRRFRHCAMRSLMILRSYMGRTKRVGRQQVSSMILLSALKRISTEFFIIREAKREVLEDLMDVENAVKVIEGIESGRIKIDEIRTTVPTPFAFNIVLQSFVDILKIDDKVEFLKRMHELVQAKIALNEGKQQIKEKRLKAIDYDTLWKKQLEEKEEDIEYKTEMKDQLAYVAEKVHIPDKAIAELNRMISGDREDFSPKFLKMLDKHLERDIPELWPAELAEYVKKIRAEIKY